jgi:ubiquinone/menaquinone biosynthesis C-methylase UbiE
VYAELCTEKGFVYTGIDLSKQMIAEGHKRCRKLAAPSFVIGRPDAREIRRQLILMEGVQ